MQNVMADVHVGWGGGLEGIEQSINAARGVNISGINCETNGLFSAFARALQEAFDLATVARQRGANLLILGENGTGKELVAEQYHRAGSPKGPFVPVNSAAISSTLADSLLFGTRRGAFTETRDSEGLVVAADGGVLFLDEIVELSPEVQVRLLRAVQSGAER